MLLVPISNIVFITFSLQVSQYVIFSGTQIGIVGDSDLITVAKDKVTVSGGIIVTGELDATTLKVGGKSITGEETGDVKFNGSSIGIVGDTDLITLEKDRVTVKGELDATTLKVGGENITGDVKFSGSNVGIVGNTDLITLAKEKVDIKGNLNLTSGDQNFDWLNITFESNTKIIVEFNGIPKLDNNSINWAQSADHYFKLKKQDSTVIQTTDYGVTYGTVGDSVNVTLQTIEGKNFNDAKTIELWINSKKYDLGNWFNVVTLPESGSDALVAGPSARHLSMDGQKVVTIQSDGGVSVAGELNATTLKVGGKSITGTGDVKFSGSQLGIADDLDLIKLAENTVTVAGEVNATTLKVGGKSITGGGGDTGDVKFDGSSIGIADDTDLITLAKNTVTVKGELSANSLALSADGTFKLGTGVVTASHVADYLSGNITLNGATQTGHNNDQPLTQVKSTLEFNGTNTNTFIFVNPTDSNETITLTYALLKRLRDLAAKTDLLIWDNVYPE